VLLPVGCFSLGIEADEASRAIGPRSLRRLWTQSQRGRTTRNPIFSIDATGQPPDVADARIFGRLHQHFRQPEIASNSRRLDVPLVVLCVCFRRRGQDGRQKSALLDAGDQLCIPNRYIGSIRHS